MDVGLSGKLEGLMNSRRIGWMEGWMDSLIV